MATYRHLKYRALVWFGNSTNLLVIGVGLVTVVVALLVITLKEPRTAEIVSAPNLDVGSIRCAGEIKQLYKLDGWTGYRMDCPEATYIVAKKETANGVAH